MTEVAGILVVRKLWIPRFARCEACGAEYLMRSPVHRFCGDLCRRKAMYGVHTCPNCGREFVPTGWAHTHTHTCSRRCAREIQAKERSDA
jgi:predicted RNA-binding Zn-ribbon protein involved in translation (DUF1610 family)